MQHAAFHVHLVEFHPAGLRDTQAMPEDQEQQATVANLVPAALRRFNQPFNLPAGEVLPVVDIWQPHASVPRFRPFINLSRVWPVACPGNPY